MIGNQSRTLLPFNFLDYENILRVRQKNGKKQPWRKLPDSAFISARVCMRKSGGVVTRMRESWTIEIVLRMLEWSFFVISGQYRIPIVAQKARP